MSRRNRWLRAAIICFILALIGLWLMGCAHEFKPLCVEKAIYTALSAARAGHPVGIAHGPSKTSKYYHAQGIAEIDGKLEYLILNYNKIPTVGPPHWWFRHTSTLTVREALDLIKIKNIRKTLRKKGDNDF